ncbi:hypothetical protein DSECCO2_321900 [anaerobic digester metagenome]
MAQKVGIADLPELMLSGNFPEEVVFQGDSAVVSIYKNGELLLEEEYVHDGSYLISLKLRELLDGQLTTTIPVTGDLVDQTDSAADFEIHIPGQQGAAVYPFRLVKGGVNSDIIDSASFLRANFLTWMPRVKKVKYLDPQWLTYYAVAESKLMVQATWLENGVLSTSDPVEFYTLPYRKKTSMNVKFEMLWDTFSDEARAPYYIDCWIEDEGHDKKTYTQRYVLSDEYHEFDDLFAFENSLGGFDVIRFTGELSHGVNHEYKSALFDKDSLEYDLIFKKVFEKNTGYFRNGYELLWTNDFLASINRYHYVNCLPLRIVVNSFEAKDVKTELNHYSFNFSYSKQSRYLDNSSIIAQLPGMISEFSGMPLIWDDIYVRVFGDQSVDGVKTFLQPVKTNEVKPASGEDLILNDLVVQEGGIIDCGEF